MQALTLERSRLQFTEVTVRLTACYQRDERGMWTVELLEDPGVHSYGKRLAIARAAIRLAAARWAEVDPGDLELADRVILPPTATTAIAAARVGRQQAEIARHEAVDLTRSAAHTLVNDLNLTVRDAADLLGVSPSLISHLLNRAAADPETHGLN